MSNDTRPVWPTRAMRDYLATIAEVHDDYALREVVREWDAAPADATEAVRVLVQTIASLRDPWDAIDETTAAVLAALGMP